METKKPETSKEGKIMDKRDREAQKTAETPNEARNREIQKEVRKMNDLRNLAKTGNIFAINEQKLNETGLKANFRAFLPKRCTHRREMPNGQVFEAKSAVSRWRIDGWLKEEKICPLCGKTLELTIVSSNRA